MLEQLGLFGCECRHQLVGDELFATDRFSRGLGQVSLRTRRWCEHRCSSLEKRGLSGKGDGQLVFLSLPQETKDLLRQGDVLNDGESREQTKPLPNVARRA